MIPLNYHHLYYFYVIAKSETLTKACETLYLAQSTLSAQLSQFEKAIGRKLFERRKRRLVLTEDGRLVLDYAESIFEMGRELQDVLRDNRMPGRLAIQIGVLNGTPKSFCHALAECIYERMPEAFINLQEGDASRLLKDLQDYDLDLILTDVIMRGSQPDEFSSHLVARVPVVFAAARELAKRVKRFPEDLNGLPFVLPSHPSQVHRQVLDLFAEWRIAPRVLAEIQDIEVARRLAISGRGIVPLNAYSVSVSLPKNALTVIEPSKPLGVHESLYIVTRKRKRLNPLAEHVVKSFSLGQIALNSR